MADKRAQEKPGTVDEYLELLTKAVFKSGLSLATVEKKWDGFREAFDGFEAKKIAGYGEEKIDELSRDERIVRARKKIEATVENANVMLELDEEHGGFGEYLRSLGDFEEQREDLKRRFRYVGDSSAHWFLWKAGQPVPDYRKSKQR